jgi:rsbT co-antagonist protein RsbR
MTSAEELARVEAEAEALEARMNGLMEAVPFSVVVLKPDGSSIQNPPTAAVFGQGADPSDPNAPPDAWKQTYHFFAEDKVTPIPVHELAGVKAMMGQTPDAGRMWVQPPQGEGVMVSIYARPLPGHSSVSVARDVTSRARLESELASRLRSLAEREQENHALIEKLRMALDALATPVLEVDEDVLVLPVVGLVDSRRAAQISERLLNEVARQQASWVVLDLTGVEVVDTATAASFASVVRGVELLGARCIASGLSPTVVQTLVELGTDLARLETYRSLREALERCAEASREKKRKRRRR